VPRYRITEHRPDRVVEVEAANAAEAELKGLQRLCGDLTVARLETPHPEEPEVCVTGMCVNDATCPRQLHCQRHACDCPED
jgi:hypothetical protein